MLALRGGAAHVGDRLRGRGRGRRGRVDRRVADRLAGERVARRLHEERRRRDGAEGDARRLERRAVGRERDAGGGVHDGDVHLVARDEALERGAAVRRRRRERQRDEQLAGLQHVRPGAVQKSSTGTVRVPLGPAISHVAPSAISVGIESAAGELLQRLPPRLARDWIWMPPMSDAESISAGKRLRDLGVVVDARARRRRADAQRAVGAERQLVASGMCFTSTMTPTFRRPFAGLDDDVGAAGEHTRGRARAREHLRSPRQARRELHIQWPARDLLVNSDRSVMLDRGITDARLRFKLETG